MGQAAYGAALVQEGAYQVGTDMPGSAGNDYGHTRPIIA